MTSKATACYQLGYKGIYKTGYLFTIGLEPIAQPLSESAERQMLESNQRVINDVAASILKLVHKEINQWAKSFLTNHPAGSNSPCFIA